MDTLNEILEYMESYDEMGDGPNTTILFYAIESLKSIVGDK